MARKFYFRSPLLSGRITRGPINSPEFLDDYRHALLGKLQAEPTKPDTFPVVTNGSIRQLCIGYFKSSDFCKLDPRGQRARRGILERFCQSNNDGDKPYDRLEPWHLRKRRDVMMDRPEAANSMLKAVRQLFKYAMKYENYDKNPTAIVEYFLGNPDGFHA